MDVKIEENDNLKYQRWLAASLVASLGHEGAVRACQQMAWYGVLGCLMTEEGKNLPQPAA